MLPIELFLFNCYGILQHILVGLMSHQHCKGCMVTSSFTGDGSPQVPLRVLFQAKSLSGFEPTAVRGK